MYFFLTGYRHLDVHWIILCYCNTTLVNYIEECHKEDKKSDNPCIGCCMRKKAKFTVEIETQEKYLKKSNIHKISRVLFPVSYVVFNIVYWMYYTGQG